MSVIYLDFNRTTPLAPSVMEAMEPYWTTHFMLPGQEHVHAQAVAEALEHAREGLAMLAKCEPFEIVFTGGGTEANNLGIRGLLAKKTPGHILVSELEHDSVLGATEFLASEGWQVEMVPVDACGIVCPDRVADMIRDDTDLACIQLANPVLGTIQNIQAIADQLHNRGVPIHCDATQAFGKIPVDVNALRVDTMSISGHKFYGPKGTGALYVRRGLEITPITFGEPREMGVRPGPENVPAYVGIGTAARLASKCAEEAEARLTELRERLVSGIRCALDPEPAILCEDSPTLPNTVAIEMPVEAKKVQKMARQLVVATAQSSQPADELTRCLRAVGMNESRIARTMRFSLGWTTSQEQVDRAIDMITEACDSADW